MTIALLANCLLSLANWGFNSEGVDLMLSAILKSLIMVYIQLFIFGIGYNYVKELIESPFTKKNLQDEINIREKESSSNTSFVISQNFMFEVASNSQGPNLKD